MDSSEFGTSRPNRPNQNEEEENEVIPFENEELPGDDIESEGEDIMENAEDDYRAIPELDQYEQRGIDDDELDEDDDDARRRAEMALDRREDRDNRGATGRDELLYDPEDDEQLEDRDRADRAMAYDGIAPDQELEHLEDTRGMSVREWVSKPEVQTEIGNRFKDYLKNYSV